MALILSAVGEPEGEETTSPSPDAPLLPQHDELWTTFFDTPFCSIWGLHTPPGAETAVVELCSACTPFFQNFCILPSQD